MKDILLAGIVTVNVALSIMALHYIVSYDDDTDASHHKSYSERQTDTFADSDFDDPSVDTVTTSRYKIEVEDGEVTVTAEAKYSDGSELTEADKKLVAEMLRQIGQKHVNSHETYIAGGYGEVEDVNGLYGSCGYYKTKCCGKAYVCPRVKGEPRREDHTVYGRSGFSNTVNPSMKMPGTASSLSSYPGISF